MQALSRGISIACAMASVACAASVEETCERLASGLSEQAELLARVTDAETAARWLPALQRNARALDALHGQAPAAELWTHIDKTVGLKLALTKHVQRICLQYSRLESAGFYGNADLRALLAPRLKAQGGAKP